MRKTFIAIMAAGLCSAAPLPVGAAAPQRLDNVPARIVAAHNRYRSAAGVAPLRWDPQLAAAAARYGPQLGSLGRLAHSSRASRPGQSENLWMGTRGAYSIETMVESWASERTRFRSGTFPKVSTTGNWQDVAHYTQMIWPGTTHVGCALYRARQWDYFICRYAPRGNVDGRRVP